MSTIVNFFLTVTDGLGTNSAFPSVKAVGVGPIVEGATTSIWPAHDSGDLGVLLVGRRRTQFFPNAISDWNAFTTQDYFEDGPRPTGNVVVTPYSKVAASNSEATDNVGNSAGVAQYSRIVTFEGATAVQELDPSQSGGRMGSNGADVTQILGTPGATQADNALVFGVVSNRITGQDGNQQVTAVTAPGLTNITILPDFEQGADFGISLFTAERATAGDIGTVTVDSANSGHLAAAIFEVHP